MHSRKGELENAEACATRPAEGRADPSTIELKKEEVRAEKTNDQVGEVRVRKEIVTQRKTLEVPVTREEVVIEHHPAKGKGIHFGSSGR